MGELGGVTQYLYWSSRRTERFLNDNNLPIPQLATTISSPSIRWLPTLSRTVVDLGNRRPLIAKKIETALGQVAVSRFDGPTGITYAKGLSPVVFGEFKNGSIRDQWLYACSAAWTTFLNMCRRPVQATTAVLSTRVGYPHRLQLYINSLGRTASNSMAYTTPMRSWPSKP